LKYITAYTLWLVVFFVIPLIIILSFSFLEKTPYGGVNFSFSLEGYKSLLTIGYLRILWGTVWISIISTFITIIFALPTAYYIAKSKFKNFLLLLVVIPFWTNSLMRLNSWLLLFQTKGPVNDFLQYAGFTESPVTFVYTDGLVLLGLVTNMLPFAVLPMYSSIEKLSKSLLEASEDLGASKKTTFFNITLPLTFPGIFSSIILVFIPSLGIYTVTDMLGGGKVLYIGNIIKNQFGAIRNWPLGAALSVLLMVITGLLIFLYTRFASIDEMEVV